MQEDVTHRVREFLEYVIQNHDLSSDAPEIMHAFQLSVVSVFFMFYYSYKIQGKIGGVMRSEYDLLQRGYLYMEIFFLEHWGYFLLPISLGICC